MNENQNEYVDINVHDNYPDSDQKVEIPTMKVIPLKKICMTIGELPSSYLETMTYYEMLVWFIEYLKNNIIPTVNGNGEAVEELQTVVMELQNYINEFKDSIDEDVEGLEDYINNYFENLDVQEEVNTKLDQMLEDGVLEQIIEQFLQSTAIWCFDTVADMKAATNLIDGSDARTLGYYSINDGGGSLYHITDRESLTEYQEELNSGLYATLLHNEIVNVNQYGAYGDNTHDDTEAINNAINSGASIINFIKDKTYLVSYNENVGHDTFLVPSNTTIDLCESTIKLIANNSNYYRIFSFYDVENSTLKNGRILGDVETHTGTTGEWGYGVSIVYSNNITIDNLYIEKCWGDGININFKSQEEFDSNNIKITNTICDYNRRQGMSIEAGNNIMVENCKFINTGQIEHTSPSSGIDIEPAVSSKTLKNIIFRDCEFTGNRGIQFVGGGLKTNSIVVNDVTIDNCIIEDTNTVSDWCLWLRDIGNLKVTNSHIGKKTIILQPTNDCIFENNNVTARIMNIKTDSCSNSIFNINNNIFRTPLDVKSTIGLIHNYSNTPTLHGNNSAVITNNKFIDKTSGDYVYSSTINLMENQGMDKAIIKNNYIQGSAIAINVSTSSIVKNNTICGQTFYGMQLGTAFTAGYDPLFDIENNNFQNCGSQSSVIFNLNKNNGVIRNNVYYPKYFNTGIGETNYTKTLFVAYTTGLTGYTLIEDNNIISETT